MIWTSATTTTPLPPSMPTPPPMTTSPPTANH
ncbi:hypothetical protein ACHAXA_007155, partial [Cyclostephanos tholiformis]